jgi:hypothetical protein
MYFHTRVGELLLIRRLYETVALKDVDILPHTEVR